MTSIYNNKTIPIQVEILVGIMTGIGSSMSILNRLSQDVGIITKPELEKVIKPLDLAGELCSAVLWAGKIPMDDVIYITNRIRGAS